MLTVGVDILHAQFFCPSALVNKVVLILSVSQEFWMREKDNQELVVIAELFSSWLTLNWALTSCIFHVLLRCADCCPLVAQRSKDLLLTPAPAVSLTLQL